MEIIFLATLPPESSTIIGRTVPLAEELQKRGHRVKILTLGNNPEKSDSLISIVGPAIKSTNEKKHHLFTTLRRLIAGKKKLEKALRSYKPDLVILEKAHPQNVSARIDKNIPIVLDVDDDEKSASRMSFWGRLYMSEMEKKGAKTAKLVTACSPALVNRYRNELKSNRVELVPTGISTEEEISAPDVRQKFSIPQDAQIVTYIGSISLASGHRVDQILSIWEKLSTDFSKVHLLFIGDGIDFELVREQTTKLKNSDRIHFWGRFDVRQSENFARQSSVLIDPVDNSKACENKSSFRTILGLKTGVPVIAGAVGIRKMIIPETLHNWTLYNPDNLDSLYKSITFALKPGAKEEFVKKTKDEWKKWSWPEIGSKFVSLIEQL